MKQSRKVVCLAALAFVLSAGAGADRAMAYFTDHVSASGGASVRLSLPDTELKEDVIAGTKQVTVVNTGDCDCYVRVQAYAGVDPAGKSRIEDWKPGEGWVKGTGSDPYYYYNTPLAPGAETSRLDIVVSLPGGAAPEELNVIVVSEHAPVMYDTDGVPDRDRSWADGREE